MVAESYDGGTVGRHGADPVGVTIFELWCRMPASPSEGACRRRDDNGEGPLAPAEESEERVSPSPRRGGRGPGIDVGAPPGRASALAAHGGERVRQLERPGHLAV